MKPLISHRFTFSRDCDGRIVRRCLRGERCAWRGCKQDGNPCWLPDDLDKPSEWYCWRHMYQAGYCPGCGNFSAGIESFDFSRYELCDNCEWQVKAEEEREQQDWEGWEFDPWEEAL